MAVSAPILASQTLAVPTGYRRVRTFRGGQQMMADGTLSTDLVNTAAKHVFELSWAMMTDAQLTTLRTAFDAIKDTSGSYTDVDGTVYSVTLDENGLELDTEMVKIAGAGNYRWRTSLKLRQV